MMKAVEVAVRVEVDTAKTGFDAVVLVEVAETDSVAQGVEVPTPTPPVPLTVNIGAWLAF